MKIYLVRHGEVDNPEDVLYGRLPGFHLSEVGKLQIAKLAEELKDQNIEAIYSSPMERTLETAQIIAKTIGFEDKDIKIDERLIESDCREFAGKSRDEFKERTRQWESILNQTDIEPIQDAGRRVMAVLREIVAVGKNTAVVSHGDPIMGALWLISKNDDIFDRYIKRGTFIKIEIKDGKWQVAPTGEV